MSVRDPAWRYSRLTMSSVDGWLELVDAELFRTVDHVQRQRGVRGDLVDVGVYRGRSAVLLGLLADRDEQVIACDLFEDAVPYPGRPALFGELRREQFERVWSQHVGRPVRVIQRLSTELASLVPAGSCRVVHVDANHGYSYVLDDLRIASTLVVPGGVVIADDWRRADSPGVGAAFWRLVHEGTLIPALLSESKAYAVSVGGSDGVSALQDAARGGLFRTEDHMIAGRTVVRVSAGAALRRWARLRVIGAARRRLRRHR